MKKVLFLIFFVLAALAGYYFLTRPKSTLQPPVSIIPDGLFGWKFPVAKFPATGSNPNLIAYSDIRDPGGIPQGLPVRLKIPAIDVDSAIEDAYISSDGRMDVPAGSVNVAWFSLGPHPGQVGSAVIGGHFGIKDNIPFVFYNLDKLVIGDKVYILDDNGDTLAFMVKRITSFDRDADATTVFTSTDGLAHLNLITCEGVWNQVNDSYPQRLIVFTDAIPSEGPVVIEKTKSTAVSASAAPTLPTTAVPIVAPVETISLQSLYATPLDTAITALLALAILVLTVKIIRRR